MRLTDCHNFADFRRLANKPTRPHFSLYRRCRRRRGDLSAQHGAEQVDLVPNVLNGVDNVDMSIEVMGQKLAMPLY